MMIDDTYNEKEYIRTMLNMLETHNMVSIVGDTFDIFRFIDILGELKDEVLEKTKGGKVVVVRPDSGDPCEMVLGCIEKLGEHFGMRENSKGYMVLPNYIRVIQGDGLDALEIQHICAFLKLNKISISNVAFGMGGGLLQNCTRDTMKFAMKASYIEVNGVGRDIFKNPASDTSKASKKGVLSYDKKKKKTVPRSECTPEDDGLKVLYRNGVLLSATSFSGIRNRLWPKGNDA